MDDDYEDDEGDEDEDYDDDEDDDDYDYDEDEDDDDDYEDDDDDYEDDDDDYEDDDDNDYGDIRGGRSNSLNFHVAMFFSLTRFIHLTHKINYLSFDNQLQNIKQQTCNIMFILVKDKMKGKGKYGKKGEKMKM